MSQPLISDNAFKLFKDESNNVVTKNYFNKNDFLLNTTSSQGYTRNAVGALTTTVGLGVVASGAGATLIEGGGGVGAGSLALKAVSSKLLEGGAIQTVTEGVVSKVPIVAIGGGICAALGLVWFDNLVYRNPQYLEELYQNMLVNGANELEWWYYGFLKDKYYYVPEDLINRVANYNREKGCFDAGGFMPIPANALQFNTPLDISTIGWTDFREMIISFLYAKYTDGKISQACYTDMVDAIDNKYMNDVLPWLNGRTKYIALVTCDNEGFNVEGGDRFNFDIHFYVADANGKFIFAPNTTDYPSLTQPYIEDYNDGAFDGKFYWGYPDEYQQQYSRGWRINLYLRGNGLRSVGSYLDAVFGALYYTAGMYVLSNIGSISGGSQEEGVEQQEDAVCPVDPSVALSVLYPDWALHAKNISIYHPDTDTNEEKKFYPLKLAVLPITDGVTIPQDVAQVGEIADEDEDEQDLVADGAIEAPTQVIDQDLAIPMDIDIPTDSGVSPTIPLPFDISGNGMIMVYNPTKAELQGISSFLWSTNFIDNIKKIFNDPMQAIISLHVLYAKPTISSNKTDVKIGFLDSGVDSYYVTEQYVEIDCGSVTLNEYFGNYMDYDFTEVYLHLPFVGIVQLKTTDVMRSIIHVKYKVDVVSGCCLCNVSIEKNDMDAILYTYSGNCSVPIPYSASNYANMITGLLGVAGATIGAIASGGATLALGATALASLGNALHRDISHGGSLSGNAGAMGVKTPYLIVNRHTPYYSERQKQYDGLPSNEYVKLGTCVGFTRIKEVHLLNLNATDEEINMIDEQLKGGVIL